MDCLQNISTCFIEFIWFTKVLTFCDPSILLQMSGLHAQCPLCIKGYRSKEHYASLGTDTYMLCCFSSHQWANPKQGSGIVKNNTQTGSLEASSGKQSLSCLFIFSQWNYIYWRYVIKMTTNCHYANKMAVNHQQCSDRHFGCILLNNSVPLDFSKDMCKAWESYYIFASAVGWTIFYVGE